MSVIPISDLLGGKTALVVGVRDRRSIAFGIAEALLEQGAHVVFSCHPGILNIQQVLEPLGGGLVVPADLADEAQTKGIATALKISHIKVDTVIYSAAFIHPRALRRPLYQLSKETLEKSMEVTAFSFVTLVGGLVDGECLNRNASIMAMTYSAASQRVQRWYKGESKAALENIIRTLADELGQSGFRVNGISAAPTDTTAAGAIPHFADFYRAVGEQAPLRRTINGAETGNVFPSDIGGVAVCLASSLMRAVTGQIIEVDCGFGNMVAFPVNFARE